MSLIAHWMSLWKQDAEVKIRTGFGLFGIVCKPGDLPQEWCGEHPFEGRQILHVACPA